MTSIVLGLRRLADLLLLRHHGEDQAQVRRHARRVRRPLHRRHRRRARHRHRRRPGARRPGLVRLHRRSRPVAGEYDMAGAADHPAQGGRRHPGLVGRRSRRSCSSSLDKHHRPASDARKSSAKASTSPSMASAPTTTDSPSLAGPGPSPLPGPAIRCSSCERSLKGRSQPLRPFFRFRRPLQEA